jgi:hypothetical protein
MLLYDLSVNACTELSTQASAKTKFGWFPDLYSLRLCSLFQFPFIRSVSTYNFETSYAYEVVAYAPDTFLKRVNRSVTLRMHGARQNIWFLLLKNIIIRLKDKSVAEI